METIKKVVVIGPESTGKSTLCQRLAEHYNTLWVPEYAREYLEKNRTKYSYDDLLTIAKGQIELEEKATQQLAFTLHNSPFTIHHSPLTSHLPIAIGTPLFIDTDMYVMKVWAEFVFNKCHNWILNSIAERSYDLYLLCDTDLPWVEDALREYPDKRIREKLFSLYKELMVNQSTPWCIISGNYEERLEKAIQCVDASFT
jgi:nicotinamide riboside kinase